MFLNYIYTLAKKVQKRNKESDLKNILTADNLANEKYFIAIKKSDYKVLYVLIIQLIKIK